MNRFPASASILACAGPRARPVAFAYASALVVWLGGCGGGGSTSGPSAPATATSAPAVNVAAAWHNVLTTRASWSTTGTGPRGNYEEDLSLAPGSAATFAVTGTAGSTSQRTIQEALNGGAFTTTGVTVYFNSDTPFGSAFSDGSCSHYQPPLLPFPPLGPIGSSGPLGISIASNGCPSLAILTLFFLVVTTDSWSVESDSGATLFCVNSSSTDLLGNNLARTSICIETAADGSFGPKARLTRAQASTGTITTRNF